MRILPNSVIRPAEEKSSGAQSAATMPKTANGGFNNILSQTIAQAQTQVQAQPLQFSKHASMRLNTRDIALNHDQIKRVEEGVNKAYAKGIKDSLVFVDNVALVVNVRSRTVVTAIHSQQENIFTNIDGAVIV